MENDLLSISRIFFCGMDVYMLYRFFSAMFTKKLEKKHVIISIATTGIIFFENSFGSIALNFFTMPLLYYAYVRTLFNISKSNSIAYTIIYFAFAGSRELSFELLYRFLLRVLPVYISPWYASGGIYLLLIQYFASFLLLLFIEKFIKKLEIGVHNTFSWYLLIVPILSLMVSVSFLHIEFPESLITQIAMCGGSFSLFFTNVVIFIILARYTDAMNKIKYAELSNVKRHMEEEHLQNILKLNEDYQRYMHDIHTYFNSFRMLAASGENNKIVEIIDELKGEIQEKTSGVIYSGHPVLNAILSERVLTAKEKGIQLTIFVEKFLKVDFISDADMISMFGNLLDNALEAAGRCSPENRKVNIKIFKGNNYFLIFYIENSYAVAVKREGERFLSTKTNSKGHGLGIGIVANLAEKYGGTLNLEEKEDFFITTLAISTYARA